MKRSKRSVKSVSGSDRPARGWTLFLFAMLILPGLPGCFVAPEGIPVVRGIEQDDIPVPPSFEFQNSESPDYGTIPAGKFRSWAGTYRGGGKADELVPWYIQEMPKFEWKFERLETLPREKSLYFHKGNEYAVIHLYREITARDGTFSNVVRAEIRPTGPEDYTAEENLESIQRRVRPASYRYSPPSSTVPGSGTESRNSTGPLNTGPLNTGGAATRGRVETTPQRTGTLQTGSLEAERRAQSFREIDSIERSHRP